MINNILLPCIIYSNSAGGSSKHGFVHSPKSSWLICSSVPCHPVLPVQLCLVIVDCWWTKPPLTALINIYHCLPTTSVFINQLNLVMYNIRSTVKYSKVPSARIDMDRLIAAQWTATGARHSPHQSSQFQQSGLLSLGNPMNRNYTWRFPKMRVPQNHSFHLLKLQMARFHAPFHGTAAQHIGFSNMNACGCIQIHRM